MRGSEVGVGGEGVLGGELLVEFLVELLDEEVLLLDVLL